MKDNAKLGAWAKLLLWEFRRGSAAYDLLCLIILLVVFLVPSPFWGIPCGVAAEQTELDGDPKLALDTAGQLPR